MNVIELQTRARTEFIDVTRRIESLLAAAGFKGAGTAFVFVPHTTAGATLNENADPDVTADMADALDRIVPWSAGYRHGEGNAAAHVKASLVGHTVAVPFENGRLCLGVWQAIYFCEFDGPRRRQLQVRLDPCPALRCAAADTPEGSC